MSAPEPTFYVGGIPVFGNTILAPMAGYSDVPYRAICRAFGSAMHYTEFVPVEALQGKRNRFWDRLDKLPDEHPMVFQIFGNDPQLILTAAQRIEGLGPDIIDINMGCSTRKVSGRGAGVGMMPQPAIIAETFDLLSRHLSVPVTGKIRLGYDEQMNYLEIGRVLAENGAALVAMHGRTKEQKYAGEADWEAIARLKQELDIPVIGSGDITTPDDIDCMLAATGCDAVMIGRGAIGNPWLFARKSRDDLRVDELVEAIVLHLRAMVAYYGERHGVIQFRKHLKRYVAGVAALEGLLPVLLRLEDGEAVEAALREAVATAVRAGGVRATDKSVIRPNV